MTDPSLEMTKVWLLYSITKLEMFVGKNQCPIADRRAWGRVPKWCVREDVIGLCISDVQSNCCVYPWEWRGQAVIVMKESLMGNCDWENCHWMRKGDCALGVKHPWKMWWKIKPKYSFALWNMKQALWRQVNKVGPFLVYGPSVVPSTEWFSQFVGCAGAAEQQGKTFAPNIPYCWRRAHLLWLSIGASPVYLPFILEGSF